MSADKAVLRRRESIIVAREEGRGGERGGGGRKPSSAMLALHRSRCIDWRPKPIVAMAATTIRREDSADKGRDLEVGTSASSGKQPVVDEEIALLAVARASG